MQKPECRSIPPPQQKAAILTGWLLFHIKKENEVKYMGCSINLSSIPITCDGCENKPYIGENGNWYVGDTDTGVKAQGPAGQDADPAELDWLSKGLEALSNKLFMGASARVIPTTLTFQESTTASVTRDLSGYYPTEITGCFITGNDSAEYLFAVKVLGRSVEISGRNVVGMKTKAVVPLTLLVIGK